jgi:aspartyl protease family protein
MGEQERAAAGAGVRRWGHVGVLAFWLAVMGVVYLALDHTMKPKAAVVTAAGELRIPRARDGHFYVEGTVNGRPITFLVDTGASTVFVSEAFARQAGLQGGEPTTFQTANGTMPGRTLRGVAVSVGPFSVSSVRVGIGLVGGSDDHGLLGQNFLGKFSMRVSDKELVLGAGSP